MLSVPFDESCQQPAPVQPYPPRWQQRGNTTPCTNRKTLGGETAEIGVFSAFSATDHNQRQAPRRPRNERVSGSNPLVGLFCSLEIAACLRALMRIVSRHPSVVATLWATCHHAGQLMRSSRTGDGAIPRRRSHAPHGPRTPDDKRRRAGAGLAPQAGSIVPSRKYRTCHDNASSSRCGVCLPDALAMARSK
jgi:hypothetical protein